MKIKRYEASSMTEALRKVKKDFGEDAVILSAKATKKQGGVFSTKNGGKVVVTAAIDMAPAGKKSSAAKRPKIEEEKAPFAASDFEEVKKPAAEQVLLSDESPASLAEPRASTNRTMDCEVPKWFANQPPKLVPLKSEALLDSECKPALNADLYKIFRANGLNPVISHEVADQIHQIAGGCSVDEDRVKEVLAAIIEERRWVADPAGRGQDRGKPIVLVGVHGSGKTTTAVKLAAEALLNQNNGVTVLSLDYQRIAAHVELERAAYVMGIKLLTASNKQQLKDLIPQIQTSQYTIIDTTGVAIGEEAALEELAALLAHLGEVEIHLVLNACLQEAVAARMIDFYRPLGVDRLLFTQADNVDNVGHLFNLIENHDLPVSYMGHGAQVPGDLYVMSVESAAQMLLPKRAVKINAAERSIEQDMPEKDRVEEFQPLFKEFRQAGGLGSQVR